MGWPLMSPREDEQWLEEGKWVSQNHTIPVEAGGTYCVYLLQKGSALESTSELATNLGKLSAEDRKVAEQQKFCAVQNGVPLGAMGVPVKVTLEGKPVFLCCQACKDRAEKDAKKTLSKAQELQAMSGQRQPKN